MVERRQVIAALLAVPVGTLLPRAAGPTRYGVISATQGSEPDTADNFVRLYDRQRATYTAPIGIRIFSPDLLPLPTDASMSGKLLAWAASRHPEELITVSHKTAADAGRLRRFLDWVGARGLRASIIYYHEVQAATIDLKDPRAKPEVYRTTYQRYRDVIAAHPARSRVTLEKNLMWHFQHYRAARDGGDWHDYVERNDPAGVLSWDCYAFRGMPRDLRRYATPDEFYRYALAAWREYHLPWAVGEIGSEVQNGGPEPDGTVWKPDWDHTGAKFERWVRQITAAAARPGTIGPDYATMPPARFMKWWAATDAAGHDLSLDQVPAAMRAYRELVRASPR
jgi:hypothetical protein